jgi:hypothetical protein
MPSPAPIQTADKGIGDVFSGGGDALGGLLGGIGSIASALGGKKSAPMQPFKVTPDPARGNDLAADHGGPQKGAAQQILGGVLADDVQSLIDPRKRRMV